MKTLHLFLVVSLLSIATAGLAIWTCLRVIGQNQQLSEETRQLRRDADLQAVEVRRLVAEAQIQSTQLEAARLQMTAAAEVAPQAKTTVNGGEPAVPLKAGRVRIVSGDRSLGGGWLIPVPAVAGMVPSESVVVLDETVRQALAAGGRAAPEREVYRETATYYQSYPYYWGYPVFWSDGHQRPPPPLCPTNLPPPPPSEKVLLPVTGKPFLNNKFYLPSTKPFLPPIPAGVSGSAVGAANPRMPQRDAPQALRPGLGGR